MELVACEYGRSKSFPLPFVEYGVTDWLTGVSLELGDVQIAINGGAYANIPLNQLTVVADHVIITLSDSNMQFKYAIVRIKDQSGTKVFEDTGAILTTDARSWQQALFTLIESQRGSHTGNGEQIFFDPINGNDSNSGLILNEPKLTYNFNGAGGVHSLLSANDHQIVHFLPATGGAPTTINEYIEVDTAYTFLRGPGRDFLIEATHNEACAVLASAEGIEFFGFRVKTRTNGSQDAICTTGDFTKFKWIWVDYSRGAGIIIDNASSCRLDNFLIQDAAKGGSGHALHILGDTSITTRNMVRAGEIFSNGNGGETDGIRIEGSYCEHNFVTGGATGLYIHDNTGYGINEINSANHTIVVGPTVNLAHNDLGDHSLVGANSLVLNHEQWAKAEDLATLQTSIDALPTEPVTVTGGGGSITPAYAQEGEPEDFVQGDVANIARYITGDQSAKTMFFAAKLATGDASYAVGIIQCNVGAYDAVNDVTAYLIPFAANDTKTVELACYKGETEVRDGDGTSNPVTGDRFDFNLIGEIIT